MVVIAGMPRRSLYHDIVTGIGVAVVGSSSRSSSGCSSAVLVVVCHLAHTRRAENAALEDAKDELREERDNYKAGALAR